MNNLKLRHFYDPIAIGPLSNHIEQNLVNEEIFKINEKNTQSEGDEEDLAELQEELQEIENFKKEFSEDPIFTKLTLIFADITFCPVTYLLLGVSSTVMDILNQENPDINWSYFVFLLLVIRNYLTDRYYDV